MMVHIWALLSALLCNAVICSEVDVSRELYDLNLPDKQSVNVTTIVRNLNTPVGIACGKFKGEEGIFVSSFGQSNIRFVTTNRACEQAGNCPSQWVTGTGTSGITDGDINVATFADPSRMVYLEDLNTLVVTDRANGYVRYVDFNTQRVGTMKTASGARVSLLGSAVSDSNPELDIKRHGNYFYISDSQNVYNVTGDDGTIERSFNYAVQRRYTALKKWQQANDYDISTRKIFISSISIDSERDMLYVAYTFSRSAIVAIPCEPTSSSEVYVLVSDGVSYNIPQTYPRPRNGNLFSAKVAGFALVTFPMHLHYDESDDVLYWLEVYSHLSSGTSVGALGAVALRRLKFDTNEIDYYAGNEGTFRNIIGRSTGFKDGFSNVAQFSYPITLDFVSSEGDLGTGPQMYICDYGNSAVRRVATVVNTGAPTHAPTISQQPTPAPSISKSPTPSPTLKATLSPTRMPTGSPTVYSPTYNPTTSTPTQFPTNAPTATPTLAPSISHMPTEAMEPTSVPTLLNGDCIEITLFDEFGDGWNGFTLNVTHPGLFSAPTRGQKKIAREEDPNVYFSSTALSPDLDHNPLVYRICASLDEDRHYTRGKYMLEIKREKGLPKGPLPNEWEMQWQVSTRESNYNDWQYGNITTKMEFEFGSDGVFKLNRIDRPVEDATVCTRCEHPPPKPKPKPKPKPHRQLDAEGDVAAEGPVQHKIPFVLHDSKGDGWFSPSGLGAKFSISDRSKTKLLNSGTICGDELMKEDCQAELPDGDFFFRVGGGGDENRDQISWTFCGVHGKAMQQLSFAMVEGKCVPGHLSTAASMVGAEEKTTLTMRGDLILSNVFSEDLGIVDRNAFEDAISTVLHVDSSDVMVMGVCTTRGKKVCSSGDDDNDDDGDDDGSRRLSSLSSSSSSPSSSASRELSQTFTVDVSYTVSIWVEEYNLQGSLYSETVSLFEKKKQFLDEAFKKHTLEDHIRSSALKLGSSDLAFVKVDHMVPIKKSDISYKFETLTDRPTPVPLMDAHSKPHAASSRTVVVDETVEQEELVLFPIALVAVTVLVIAGVVMWRRRLTASVDGVDDSSGETEGWRDRVLGKGASKAATDSSPDTVEEYARPVDDDNMGTERDLYRISSNEVGPSRYRQPEGSRVASKSGMMRMVNISGAGPASSTGENILRNQLQLSHEDDDSSV